MWSGRVGSKNAQIVLVASYPSSTSDDNLYDSESYIVNNVGIRRHRLWRSHHERQLRRVRTGQRHGGNVMYYDLQQRLRGNRCVCGVRDSGAASCDQAEIRAAFLTRLNSAHGERLASTPWNTAVAARTSTGALWIRRSTRSAWPRLLARRTAHGQCKRIGYVPEFPGTTLLESADAGFMKDFANQIYNVTSGIGNTEQACNSCWITRRALTVRSTDRPGILYLWTQLAGGGQRCVRIPRRPA